ncbi:hypothetical protein M3J09_006036 [Ascochyta lentis]
MAIPQDFNSGAEGHNHSQEPTEEVDLVIIGAGPTGLLSAVLARQLGLSISILDAKHGPLEVGGADAITARTQQYLEVASNSAHGNSTNILSELLNRGVKCNTSTTYADGVFTSQQSAWWNAIPHTFYNNLLMIGQPFIERHLTSHIDVPIHYAEPALSFSHTTAPVGVTVQTSRRTVKAKYCIAADGARSFVRRELGIGWEGAKPNMVWAVLDCWIDTTFPVTREIVTLQSEGEARMAWIPRERGMQRFYVLLDGEITLEKTKASIRKHMAPHTVDFTHIEWFSKFEIKERVASTLLHPTPHGPYLLAGDSAHVHSVNGGQGMNTGLSDAFSLIWRLALLVQHPSLPASTNTALLTSYDIERRATAQRVISVAAQLVRSTTADAKGYVKLIELNAGFITGMGVQYADVGSPLVRASEEVNDQVRDQVRDQTSATPTKLWTPGHRAPDLWLHDPRTSSDIRLYQKMIYGRYALILAGADAEVEEAGGRSRMEVKNSQFLSIFRLTELKARSVGVQIPASDEKEERVVVGEGDVHTFGYSYVRPGDAYAVLVRPDCYVELVGEVAEVRRYVEERLPGLL